MEQQHSVTPSRSYQGEARPLSAAPVRARRSLPLYLEIPLLVVVALLVTLAVKSVVAQAFYIPSASMEPQLREGDRVVVSRLAYRLHDPRRGDIVVFPSPAVAPEDRGGLTGVFDDVLESLALRDPGDRDLIKRVVGLPGETVEGRDGTVWIDGHRLDEPYLAETTITGDFGPLQIPEERVFVLGDNRTNSHDSRFPDIGPIDVDTIVGRATHRIWPPWRAAFL